MDVRLPDGTIIKGVPEGITQSQLREKLLRNGFKPEQFDERVAKDVAKPFTEKDLRLPPAAPKTPMEQAARLGKEFMAIPAGVYRGVQDVTDTLAGAAQNFARVSQAGGASMLGQDPTGQRNVMRAMATEAGRPRAPTDIDRAIALNRAGYEQQYGENILSQGARMAGQALGTAPAAGVVAAPVRAAGQVVPALKNVAAAIQSGGFVTGAVPRTLRGSVANIATRAVGGGVSGATTAALTDQDVGQATVVGSAVPLGGVLLGKSIDRIADVLQGQLGKVRAKKVIQNVLGDNADRAIQILRNAPDDVTPEQALLDGGIDPKDIRGFIALGSWAKEQDPKSVVIKMLDAQEQGRKDLLAITSGGASATERLERQDLQRRVLRLKTNKMREAELNRAGVTSNAMRRAEELTTEADDAARQAVDDVRKYEKLTGIAKEASRHSYDPGSGQKIPANISYPARLAKLAQEQSEISAQASLDAGLKRQGADTLLRALQDKGVKPLSPQGIISGLRVKLKNPNIAGRDDVPKVLNKVISKLNEWTDERGLIDPYALYSIRKDTVAQTVNELMGTASTKEKNKVAAGLLAEVKPLIDEAIVTAGGKKWQTYLNEFQKGAEEIDRLKMAGRAAELYGAGKAAEKESFVRLMTGESPGEVEDVFGVGRRNIQTEMIPTPKTPKGKPSTSKQSQAEIAEARVRLDALNQVSNELKRDAALEAQVNSGYALLTNAIKTVQPAKMRFPQLFSRTATIANEGFKEMEKRFDKQTVDTFISAMRSGNGVVEALALLPLSERNAMIRFLKKLPAAGFATSGAAGAAAAEPNRNAMRR